MGNLFSRCTSSRRPASVRLDDTGTYDIVTKPTSPKAICSKPVEELSDVFEKVKLDRGDIGKKVSESSIVTRRLPELPDEAEELCDRVWNLDDNLGEVFIKAFNIPITRKDLQSLRYQQWLNDEVINFYFSLICERSKMIYDLPKVYAFSTFFYASYSLRGHSGVRRWTKNMNIFSYDLVFIPLHLNNIHWCLIAVDFKQKRIGFFDSMNTNGRDHLLNILDYLKEESKEKHNSKYIVDDFDLIHKATVPKQMNGSDCGAFTCQFGEYLSRQANLNFSQSDINYFRKRMVYEIVNKTLLS